MGFRQRVSRFITLVVDYFYRPPFSSYLPRDTFRYAVVGGGNLAFGLVFYFVLFNFVLDKQDTCLFGVVTISAPIMAFLINFVVTFFTGFWLTKNVAFGGRSVLHGREQLFRYAQVVCLNIVVNYCGLKLMVEVFGFYPTLSYFSVQVLSVGISYFASKHYTFRK